MTDDRALLLFFSSVRSGPSRRMESLLAHFARKERARLRVAQVDVDERPEIATRFHVTAAPALVLIREKRPVARLDGRASAPKIEAMLEQNLEPAAVVAA